MNSPRTFEDRPAVREKVPLLIGLAGPSGGGKTFSALRLATGMQRVNGGDIYFIDTESGRACHYADRFKFRHVPFSAPFDPLSYLAAVEHCVRKGAGVIIIDSMSHEHEGPGGVLEMHDKVVEEKGHAHSMLAWAKPKAMRRRFINTILQIPCNVICCFRAKEKLKVIKGKEPEKLGIMPIAGEEFVYEMTAQALLLPNAGGIPTWLGQEIGEKMMIKLPEQFRAHFAQPRPLDEASGEFMARWAAGATTGTASKPAGKSKDVTLEQLAADLPRKAPPADGKELAGRVDWLAKELSRLCSAFSRPDLDEAIAQAAVHPDASSWVPGELSASEAAAGWQVVVEYVRAEHAATLGSSTGQLPGTESQLPPD